MALHSAKQVAARILATQFEQVADDAVSNDLNNMKLQNLLYYAQGAHLALIGRPLFSEPLVAWENGPVVENVYRDYKRFQNAPIDEVEGEFDVDDFDPDESNILQQVMDIFAWHSAPAVQDESDTEDPWRKAVDVGLGTPLDPGTMRDFFLENYVENEQS